MHLPASATSLLHCLGQLSRGADARSFELSAQDPVGSQRAYLARLLAANRETDFGRAHGFADLATPEAFAARVPLMEPADLAPWVARTMNGERGLLSHEAPVFYGASTGTTGHHKFVPITPAYRAEFQRTVKIAMWHLYRRFPGAFTSKFLYFVGPRRFEIAGDGLDVGAISGYNFTEQSALVRALYAWPYELFTVTDLEARRYMALYLAVLGDISLITGVFPLPIVNMLRDLETRGEELAYDLARGTFSAAPGLTEAQRAGFARLVRPRPDLAARLERARRLPVEERAATVFPRLRLVYCWTTSTAALYVPELKRRLGPGVAVRDAIFAATEAWCNVPMGEDAPGGPLAVDCVYTEFIEEGAYAAGERRTVGVESLVQGRRYMIVTSNSAGLYRYALGDVVEVRGQYINTPCLHFVRKAGAASNLVGEMLDESHVNAAVTDALAGCGLEATWFALVAAPDGDTPGYNLYFEPSPGDAARGDQALAAFLARVEERLGVHAYNYGMRQRSALLRPMQLVHVPQGRYDTWRQRKIAAGGGEAQLKAVHLIGDPAALPPEFQ